MKLLQRIHGQIDHTNITGVLVASRDGLVLCSDTRDIEDGSVAAMAAAAAGLSAQFVGQARLGESRAAVFEGSLGHIGVFPVDTAVLLLVVGKRDSNMGCSLSQPDRPFYWFSRPSPTKTAIPKGFRANDPTTLNCQHDSSP